MRHRVLLTDHPWSEVSVERAVLDAAGLDLVAGPVKAGTESEVDALVRANDPAAIMTCWAQVSQAAIQAPSGLKIVARLGVGIDNIAVGAATDRGAWVTNVPDYCVEEVSDHAVGLLLAHFRGIVALDRDTKRLRWNPEGARLRRISGLIIGVVGFGPIGQATARKLGAFGCRVVVVDRGTAVLPAGVERLTLAGMQEQADAIVLHLPLSDATRGMIDDTFIKACLRQPFLVNVSRGGLVDNGALLRGLDRGALCGAALDVIDGEPSPPAEILSHAGVIATPHVAFLSDASLIDLRRKAAEEVVRVLAGEAPLNACNKPNGLASGNPVSFERGVASDIQVVRGPDGPFVLKRALPKLRVAADWVSDPGRSSVEADALQVMAEIIGPQAVPKVLWADGSRHEFAMELISPRLRNWKRDLMCGQIDRRTAIRAGELLGRLHAGSADRPDLPSRFADTRFFDELRIAPYFNRIATRNPELAPRIASVVRAMAEHREALVHGDFSPKNILADGADVVLLDCEVAHWGDPRFDLAFCLTHLALKAMRRSGGQAAALGAAALDLVEAYQGVGPAILDVDLVGILGCLMLARLEGDSPVDYLSDLDLPAVKRIATSLILDPSASRGIGFMFLESLP